MKSIEPQPKKRVTPKQHPFKNLLDQFKSRRTETLAFADDFKVPFDNNRAELNPHIVKFMRKISGCIKN